MGAFLSFSSGSSTESGIGGLENPCPTLSSTTRIKSALTNFFITGLLYLIKQAKKVPLKWALFDTNLGTSKQHFKFKGDRRDKFPVIFPFIFTFGTSFVGDPIAINKLSIINSTFVTINMDLWVFLT